MNIETSALALCLAALTTLSACAPEDVEADEVVGEADSAISLSAALGRVLFDAPLPDTNGRSCATCHVQSEHTALPPANVAARLAANPHDPLFNRMDADDPGAAVPRYEHLKAGLVRVTLRLADNLDVIDGAGKVVTNAARTISVWRAVPSIENTAYTAPFQLDGRAATLEAQALDALRVHSEIGCDPPPAVVRFIADYERTVFSSPRAASIAHDLEEGDTPDDLEPQFPVGSAEAAGQKLFQQGCAPCHGGATGNQIINQAVHDQAFPVLNADGSVDTIVGTDGSLLPAQVHHDLADHHALNIGISVGTYLGQKGILPNSTGVSFPRYRLRFYTNASRTQKKMDLPPPLPKVGPTGFPQEFSVDPGRAIVTGDIADWEAFDVPQLRGISRTAPYYHDNSAPDLGAVLDIYSRFILGGLPQLGLPLVKQVAGPPESLSPTQKAQIIAYLKKI